MIWLAVLYTVPFTKESGYFDRPHLKELIVAKGLREVLAVGDGLLELGGFGDHICG
jgi:hypothetical protein